MLASFSELTQEECYQFWSGALSMQSLLVQNAKGFKLKWPICHQSDRANRVQNILGWLSTAFSYRKGKVALSRRPVTRPCIVILTLSPVKYFFMLHNAAPTDTTRMLIEYGLSYFTVLERNNSNFQKRWRQSHWGRWLSTASFVNLCI